MRPEQDIFLEKLYREHLRELEIHAYVYLGDWDLAHIATQDAFHTACIRIEVLMASPNPVGWMKNTVKNTCRNMIRTRKRHLKLFLSLEELCPAEEPAYIDLTLQSDEIQEITEELTPQEYDLLKGIYIDGASFLEMADELGISMWACRKRVERINKKNRQKNNEK